MGAGNLDFDAADRGDVVVHAGLVHLNLSDEVLGEFLDGLLLAFVMFHEDLLLNVSCQLFVHNLGSGTIELVGSVVVEPSLLLECTGGNSLSVLLDDLGTALFRVGDGMFLQTGINGTGLRFPLRVAGFELITFSPFDHGTGSAGGALSVSGRLRSGQRNSDADEKYNDLHDDDGFGLIELGSKSVKLKRIFCTEDFD